MQTIILAAGRGSRMGDVTKNSPKCLIPYRGFPLIEHLITTLKTFIDPKEIHLVSGYQAHQLDYLGVSTIVNEHWDSSNIMGSLMNADKLLTNKETLITYSDVYYKPDAISALLKANTPAVVSTERWNEVWSKRFVDPLTDLETFSVDQNGHLSEIGKRANRISDIMGQFAGIFSLNPTVWNWIKEEVPNLSKRDTTSTLHEVATRSPYNIDVVRYEGEWAEIDTLADALSQS